MQFLMFSKMLQHLSVAEAGEVIAGLGFDGVDLTVRGKGHVLPDNVTTDLPRAVDTLRGLGLTVGMLTTSITSAAQPHAEVLFRTAAECGVRFLKLGYWVYRGFGAVREQIDEIRADVKGIEELARRYDVKAALHTHSGNFMTAALAVCQVLIEGTDPANIGIYVDGGHVVLEGGFGVWRQGIDLVQDRICLLAAKSFGWFAERNEQTGQVRWTPMLLPFDKGMTDWKELLTLLRRGGFDGYVSVHSEYNNLSLDELVDRTRDDFRLLRAAAIEAGYEGVKP